MLRRQSRRAASPSTPPTQHHRTVTTPAPSARPAVNVTTTNGTASTAPAQASCYYAAPDVTGLTPVQGPTTGFTTVNISGSGFTSVTASTSAARQRRATRSTPTPRSPRRRRHMQPARQRSHLTYGGGTVVGRHVHVHRTSDVHVDDADVRHDGRRHHRHDHRHELARRVGDGRRRTRHQRRSWRRTARA